MILRDNEMVAPLASLGDFFTAVFRGAPTPQAAEAYTAQLTALISLYLCGVAVFVVGVYVRAIQRRRDLTAEQRTFKVWIASSLIMAIAVIAASVAWFLFAAAR